MNAPSIPKRLARRIDRAARAAHAFHRFAHHPLCGEYEGEVFRLGRRGRLCRGCALAAAGILAGSAAGFVLVPDPLLSALASFTALALAWKRARGLGKLATRFVPAALLSLACVGGVARADAAGAAVALSAVAAVAACVLAYRRRGPERSPCASCPERSSQDPCRGFAAIMRRERALQRLAGAWLERAGS